MYCGCAQQVCTKANMEDYGIKGVTDAEPGKEKLLHGPGLPDAAGKMKRWDFWF